MIKTITMEELHEKQAQLGPKDLILDVRSAEEYRDGHVPGSRNISFDQVPSHIDELGKYLTIYIYCHSGGRVGAACQALWQAGLRNMVAVARGGMPDWEAQGFPVER